MTRLIRTPASGATKVTILSVLLVACSCVFLAAHVSDNAIRPHGFAAVVLLTVGFFAAEVFPMHVSVGADRHTISFNELPLAIGLVVLSPAALLASMLVGNGAALVLHRRQRGVKLALNLSVGVFQTAVAVGLFSMIGNRELWSVATCVGLVVATVGADTVSAFLVTLAITLFRGTAQGLWTIRVFVGGATESLAKSLLGILAMVALIEGGNVLLAAVGASSTVAYLTYRAYSSGRTRRHLVA
jgi:hypothetical protein